jgi:hypothetical protein
VVQWRVKRKAAFNLSGGRPGAVLACRGSLPADLRGLGPSGGLQREGVVMVRHVTLSFLASVQFHNQTVG